MQKFTQNDQNHEKIYAEWHNSHLYFAKIYSICVFPVRSPSVQNVCSVGWFVLYGFYGSYGIFVHQHPCFSVWSVQFSPFICIRLIRVIRGLFCSVRILRILRIFLPICLRVFPCVPCSLFYSNTESHGFSRSLIHLHPSNPCDPWADLFCTDSTDLTESLFICIRVIRGLFCSVRI